MSEDIRTIKITADVLLNSSNDVGLAVNIGKTKYAEEGGLRGMLANEHIVIDST